MVYLLVIIVTFKPPIFYLYSPVDRRETRSTTKFTDLKYLYGDCEACENWFIHNKNNNDGGRV